MLAFTFAFGFVVDGLGFGFEEDGLPEFWRVAGGVRSVKGDGFVRLTRLVPGRTDSSKAGLKFYVNFLVSRSTCFQ